MRRSRIPDAGRQEILDVARRRFDLPTDKELAAKWGVSVTWIQTLLQLARRTIVRKHTVCVLVVPRGASTQENDAEDPTQ